MYVFVLYIYIDIILGETLANCIFVLRFFWGIPKKSARRKYCAYLSQGEGHKVWGNAPKKSNSATCAHFYKSTRYASKPHVFLFL